MNPELSCLSDQAFFLTREAVDNLFTQMRKQGSVIWCPEAFGPGYWAVIGYDEIKFVSKTTQIFSSSVKYGGVALENAEDKIKRYLAEGKEIPKNYSSTTTPGESLITMDPPFHTTQRKMIAPGFSPKVLRQLHSKIEYRVNLILDKVAKQEQCEFVDAVSAELPVQMLAELFDVPQQDRVDLFNWSNLMMSVDDPEVVRSPADIITAYNDLGEYGRKLAEQRRASTGDDLVSLLIKPDANGHFLSDAEFFDVFRLLIVAGNETTRNAISGGIEALSHFPQQKQKLIDDPELMPTAVNEILRWVTPVNCVRRTAIEDTQLGGQKIQKGDKVLLWYCSGNRDERVFTHPFSFDVARKEARHLSFGYGPHVCIGWQLAEMQIAIALNRILARFPDIQLVGEAVRTRGRLLNSIKRMDVRLTPEVNHDSL